MENQKYVQEFLRETEAFTDSPKVHAKVLYPPISLTTLTELSEARSILSDRNMLYTTSHSDSNKSQKCICERSNCSIFCTACEMFSFGRIRTSCKIHQNVVFLMDYSCCPNCHAGKYMLHEVDVDYETILKRSAKKSLSNIQPTKKRYAI